MCDPALKWLSIDPGPQASTAAIRRPSGESRVPDGIDADMDAMQLAVGQPIADRTPAEAKSDELPPGHDAVLAGCQFSNRSAWLT
jgi:hypothetical protein